jgi:DNA anti-recombination protein RmuC
VGGAWFTLQAPPGAGGGDLGPISQLLLALAAFLWVVTSTVFKMQERKEAKGHGGSITNGALARLEQDIRDGREERDQLMRRLEELPGGIREELAHLLAEQGRRIGRVEDQMDKTVESLERLREHPHR